jgi:DNA-binding NarL/FixJ family response regulator
MSKVLIAQIFDASTGETIERPLTDVEIADLEIQKAEHQTQKDEAEAKATARESALAKLKALGLTQAEISAL